MRRAELAWVTALALGCGEVRGVCAQGDLSAGMNLLITDVEGPAKHPRAGGYHFTVTTEFGVMEWTCTIGADDRIGRACASDHELDGEEGQALLVSSVATDAEFAVSLLVLESNVWTGPDEVHIEIERDGETVADAVYEPKYVLSLLGSGKGCPLYYVVDGERPTLEL
jgi:hypothetical protein